MSVAKTQRFSQPVQFALAGLAIVVLAVAFRMALQLGWRPEEIYTVQML
jgi:hypothetical protein